MPPAKGRVRVPRTLLRRCAVCKSVLIRQLAGEFVRAPPKGGSRLGR
jgi:hypothetical protein